MLLKGIFRRQPSHRSPGKLPTILISLKSPPSSNNSNPASHSRKFRSYLVFIKPAGRKNRQWSNFRRWHQEDPSLWDPNDQTWAHKMAKRILGNQNPGCSLSLGTASERLWRRPWNSSSFNFGKWAPNAAEQLDSDHWWVGRVLPHPHMHDQRPHPIWPRLPAREAEAKRRP
jgi:hypothetical protein